MCRIVSMILTQQHTYWSEKTNSHDEIIKEFGLVDTFGGDPTLVRVEVSPSQDFVSHIREHWDKHIDNWTVKLDQDIYPQWAEDDFDELFERAARAVKEWAKVMMIEQKHEDEKIIVAGKKRYVKSEKGVVQFVDEAAGVVIGAKDVFVQSGSVVHCYDCHNVYVRDGKVSCDNCRNVIVEGESSVTATGCLNIDLEGKCSGDVIKSASVTIEGGAKCSVSECASVVVKDKSSIASAEDSIICAFGGSKSRIYGGNTVYCYSGCIVELAPRHSSVIVTTEAGLDRIFGEEEGNHIIVVKDGEYGGVYRKVI